MDMSNIKHIDMNKANIGDQTLDVVDYELYADNPSMYISGGTAIEQTIGDERYILPIRNVTDLRPGVVTYNSNCTYFVRKPTEENKDQYLYNNAIIDFENTSDIMEIMEKQKQIRDIEYEMLCNPDNIFIPPMDPDDEPEVKAFKQAVVEKGIDIYKYQSRFGANFINDVRQFNKKKITLNMLKRLSNGLDIDIDITFRDKSPDVPNPIGREIEVSVTGEIDIDEEGE